MKEKIKLSSEKFKREKKIKKIFFIVLLLVLLLLLILYFVIGIIYNSGNFSITLDKNLYFEKGLIVYDDPDYKVYRTELYALSPESFDNVYYKWLPDNIDELGAGSHNGDNYLAYTFYVENMGEEISDYWSEIVIDDVVKNVDDAVRIKLYTNGEDVTYAKLGSNGRPEKNTVPFESDDLVVSNHVVNFKPGDIDRYTIVLWIEGSDPECTDNILGGEFKVHMNFNSEHIDENGKKEVEYESEK